MGVDSKHPLYVAREPDWQQMADTYEGERIVKEQGSKYLSPTSGMREDGMESPNGDGWLQYCAYRMRAVYPDYVRDAVEGLSGLMHLKPPVIKLPERLEAMRGSATVKGESLTALLRGINEEQLKKGRLGLLLEAPDKASPADAVPFVALYIAESAINWDTKRSANGRQQLELVVLNETSNVRGSDLTWTLKTSYRVLALADTASSLGNPALLDRNSISTYQVAVTTEGGSVPGADAFKAPSIAGKTLSEIPFIFVNAQDIVDEPDKPPLLGLSNSCLGIYRGEADYRQSLFQQAQETLVIIGEDEVIDPETGSAKSHRVGAGAVISLPEGGDAKYVGVSASGLNEQKEALQNDRREAAEQGVKLLEAGGESHASSGDALRVRVAARTASLVSIARTGAAALEDILKRAAVWVGANPDEVSVEPNLDFATDPLLAQELLQYMQAKAMGAPISLRTIHRLMSKREVTDLTYEEEQEEMDNDPPVGGLGLGVPADKSKPAPAKGA